ncbi:MAG: glycerol acyltransferase, partial [Myxococcales bacterium]|nr:glycerol acyltransferase [Myxococcales bacterium]
YLPILATPFPLPVRYHIYYGEPLALHEGLRPEDADNPEVVAAGALRVKEAVARLIQRGLEERVGVFS